jgi:NAD+ kinase
MSALFPRVGIVGKPGDPKVKATVAALAAYLLEQGVEMTAEVHTRGLLPDGDCRACTLGELGRRSDIAIVVGGDGTLLGAARALAAAGVPLLGINLGRLGFLADVSPDTMRETVAAVLAGDYEEERRFLLEARIGLTAEDGAAELALNDVVLHKWNTPRMVEFETHIDGSFVSVQRSDGLIVSTPTGSTAYALSGGGPLLHPALDALLLVSICPHTLSSRPLVVTGESRIAIRICGSDHPHVRVSCDGQPDHPLGPGEHLFIRKSEHPVRLLHPLGHDHYKILRAKLGWGGHFTR